MFSRSTSFFFVGTVPKSIVLASKRVDRSQFHADSVETDVDIIRW